MKRRSGNMFKSILRSFSSTFLISLVIILLISVFSMLFVKPAYITSYSNATKNTKFNIPEGEYVYTLTLKDKFISMLNSTWNGTNISEAKNMSKLVSNISVFVRKDADRGLFYISSSVFNTPVVLDTDGIDISAKNPGVISKNPGATHPGATLFNDKISFFFEPWMLTLNSSWRVSVNNEISLSGMYKYPVGYVVIVSNSSGMYKGRDAFFVKYSTYDDIYASEISSATYLIDKEKRIVLELDTQFYNFKLVKAPFMH